MASSYRFHFLVEPTTSDRGVGVEVFSNWILQVLKILSEEKQKISLSLVKDKLAKMHRLEFEISVRTRQLFNNSLRFLIGSSYVRQSKPTSEMSEPIVELANKGRKRIVELENVQGN